MRENEDPDMLMTRAQVEAQFGIGKRFLELAASRGEGPAMVRIGRSVRYRVGDLRSWIAARRRVVEGAAR